jgi:hypothetical protein
MLLYLTISRETNSIRNRRHGLDRAKVALQPFSLHFRRQRRFSGGKPLCLCRMQPAV